MRGGGGRTNLEGSPSPRWRASFLFWLAALLPATGFSADTIALRWVAAAPAVEVTGLPATTLADLEKAALAPEAWRALLAVYVEQADPAANRAMPPMAGTWRIAGGVIRFEPQFPFAQGVHYRAEFFPARVFGRASGAAPVVSSFQLPTVATPATTLTQVYPSVETLPENHLKFYLQFSGPMSGGGIYEHIKLRDASGREVDKPFLELDEELWDPGMTRLTLFIDPGRIKRGVKPHEDVGAVFEAGKTYTLSIDASWRDAAGKPLKAAVSKTYRIVAADRTSPDTARWKVRPAKAGTREPLQVEFDEPMDHALALRMIGVMAPGRSVVGEASLGEGDRLWSFVPAQPWRTGAHRLLVATTIEDLAGNNIGKAFDVEMAEGAERGLSAEKAVVPFEIK